MIKNPVYILLAISLFSLFACQQQMICPAYTSSFILDNQEIKKQFSMFGVDSLPKGDIWQIDKKKVGIADELPYHKKLAQMRTIKMESVYKTLEDPFTAYQNEHPSPDSATASVDTAAVMSGVREQNSYNIEELIYLHHFGKYFPKPKTSGGSMKEDLKPADKPPSPKEGQDMENAEKPKKKWWPFGKGKKQEKQKDKKEGDMDAQQQDQNPIPPQNKP